jgi:hypothetical protein
MARPACRFGETIGTLFRPGLDGDDVTMVQRRPARGAHVNPYPSAVQGGSVARIALNNLSARVLFDSTRRADG